MAKKQQDVVSPLVLASKPSESALHLKRPEVRSPLPLGSFLPSLLPAQLLPQREPTNGSALTIFVSCGFFLAATCLSLASTFPNTLVLTRVKTSLAKSIMAHSTVATKSQLSRKQV